MGNQKVNAQAQAGSAQFGKPKGGWGGNPMTGLGAESLHGSVGLDFDVAVASSEAMHKDVRVKTRARHGSNAQGQGQIVQADLAVPISVSKAETDGKKEHHPKVNG